MDERGPGLSGPRRPTRARRRRRALAIAGLAAVVAIVAYLALGLGAGSQTAPTTTAAVVQPKPFRVVFPEGFTRQQMAVRVQVVAGIAHRERGVHPKLSARSYLAATGPRRIPGFGSSRRPLEGFLFPATYDFLAGTTSRQLVAAQLAAFAQTWRKLDLSYARAHGLTPYDVLIIASMVEREAAVPSERKEIAAVIYNRLRDRMPLGIDSTIRYGLHVLPTQPLTETDLASDNPYNTRKFVGLPPTPIANPGLASMEAAAHPAHVDYLYFVRKPDNLHHYFTSSFQDFLVHEKEYGY